AEFRVFRSAVPDSDRARLGCDRSRLALATRAERHAGGLRSGADDKRLSAARALAARGYGASGAGRVRPGGDRKAGSALSRTIAPGRNALHAALRRKRLTPFSSGVRSISPWPTR